MNIDITPEEAKTILYELREFDKSSLINKLQKIVDDAKPKEKDFDDCFVTGYNINKEKIDGYRDALPFNQNVRETTFRTSQQIDAVRALAQLTQWYGNLDSKHKDMDSLDLCKINFFHDNTDDTIYPVIHTVSPSIMWDAAFLVFSNEKIAQDFIDSHRTLLTQASYFLI
jgi:hypothetical protein